MERTRWQFLLLLVLLLSLSLSARAQSLYEQFLHPPDDARVMMRWWWFGPAVENNELERELRVMKEGGIGGVEIQPVYALALDDPEKGIRNYPYLSDDFLERVRFANQTARQLGMRVSITLGSGWPYGGPHVPVTLAAGRLRMVKTSLPADANQLPLPSLENGETLIAAFVDGKQLPLPAEGPRLVLAPEKTSRDVLFFISSRTGQQVKRAAVGAEGFVLDHFDRAAIEHHLHTVGDRLMTAFGDQPPYSVFSDSLEVYGSDWTPDFLNQFKKRRGYDLTPYLPELFSGNDETAKSVRHDWGKTLCELIDENYLQPITAWAHEHHTLFRSQTYGAPAVTLSSNALVDLPEGEGPQWRSFSYTRWATSANHLYGRPVTSAEAWTWLHSPAFRAVPLDMKAEADLFFLEGVNQFVGHGWPYSPPYAGEPGYAFYAAAVFNDHNPWWPVMPEITQYFQRVSFLLRQGKPANDVAVYLPTDDAQANFTPGHVDLADDIRKYVTPELTASILNAGYNLDYIDDAAIEKLGVRYPVLVLPHVDRIPLAVYLRIEEYARNGGKVIAVGRLPEHAPGLREFEADSPQVAAISRKLFQSAVSEAETGAEIRKTLQPDMQLASTAPEIGFIHRKLPNADIYFVANTSNHAVTGTAHFRTSWKNAEEWDALSSKRYHANAYETTISLAPYESRIFIFHNRSENLPSEWRGEPVAAEQLDLRHNWQISFAKLHQTETMQNLVSWTEDEVTRYYSGTATYTRDFDLPSTMLKQKRHIFLDFGKGKPLPPPSDTRKPGTHALLEGPVREVAIISINGQKAGSIWAPPYQLDVTPFLHAGKNHIEIEVANTAINMLAGQSLPDYRLLNLRYGPKFAPQDMDHLEPLPSGILGSIRLVPEISAK
jgi:hypothetical protein